MDEKTTREGKKKKKNAGWEKEGKKRRWKIGREGRK